MNLNKLWTARRADCSVDLDSRTATRAEFADHFLKNRGQTSLTPPGNGANIARFGDKNRVKISREKLGSRVVQFENCINPPPKSPCDHLTDSGAEIEKESSRHAGLLCSMLFFAITVGSFSLRPSILDIHMVKPRLRTGVPSSPETEAPSSSLYRSTSLITPTPPLGLHKSTCGYPGSQGI